MHLIMEPITTHAYCATRLEFIEAHPASVSRGEWHLSSREEIATCFC